MEMKCEDIGMTPLYFNSNTFDRKVDNMYVTQANATFRS